MSTILEPEVIEPTAIELYHAQHPEVRELRETQISEIGELIGDMRNKFEPIIKEFFTEHAKPFTDVAAKIAIFCDGLPGGELTVDLYRQFVFLDKNGQTISHWLLCQLCKLGRKFPDGIDKTFSVTDLWRQLPMMLGEPEDFSLTNSDDAKKPKAKAQDNPSEFFRILPVRRQESYDETMRQLAEFTENPQFGEFSTLKERRPDLHFQTFTRIRDARAILLKEFDALGKVLEDMGPPEK